MLRAFMNENELREKEPIEEYQPKPAQSGLPQLLVCLSLFISLALLLNWFYS